MSDPDTEEIVDRLEDSLKSPYPADSKVWSAIIETLADEILELEQAREKVAKGKFVTDAEGEQLNRIGELFDIERRSDEADDVFRARLQVALRSQITSATVTELENVVSVLLDMPTSEVTIEEPFELNAAHISIDVPGDALEDSELTYSQFIDIVSSVVAAGVGVGILVSIDQEEPVFFKDAAPFDDVVTVPKGVLSDDAPFDDVVEIDLAGLNDRGRFSTIEPGVAFWNENSWDMDTYSTRLFEYEYENATTGAFGDTSSVPLIVVESDTNKLSDSITIGIPVADDDKVGLSDTVDIPDGTIGTHISTVSDKCEEEIHTIQRAVYGTGRYDIDPYEVT